MRVSAKPSVSIVIPTYNEENNIEAVVGGFLASGYSNILEILVVDGGSSDRTTIKVAELSCLYSKVKLLHNPKKIQSAALNIGADGRQGWPETCSTGPNGWGPKLFCSEETVVVDEGCAGKQVDHCLWRVRH